MRFWSSFVLGCALLACASGCSKQLWTARSLPACELGHSGSALDRERTYLAALLALNERHYVILHTSAPDEIEATYPSVHEQARVQTRWLLRVNQDGSLTVDMPPNWRQVQRNTEGRYRKLVHSVDEHRCRDPNWLRWEAQNRGLVPIGAFAAGAEASAAAGSGGEATGEAQAQLHPLQHELRAANERLDELLRERARLRLAGPIAWSAAGLVTTTSGLSVLSQGASVFAQGCTEEETPYPLSTGSECSNITAGRALMITGAALSVAGGVLLAVALPRMFRRLSQVRAVNAEINRLRKAKLAVGGDGRAWQATLRVAF